MRRICAVAIAVSTIIACEISGVTALAATEADVQLVLSSLGVEGGTSTEQKCASCHSMTNESVRAWGQKTEQTISECFGTLDPVTWATPNAALALQAVNCLRSDPTNPASRFSPDRLGLLSAGAKLPRLESLFKTAFGIAGYGIKFDTFVRQAGMPTPGAAWSFDESEFDRLLVWFQEGMPHLDSLLPSTLAPTVCQPLLSGALTTHITQMATQGWQARLTDAGLMMFACPDRDALNCFSTVKADGSPRFPEAKDTLPGKNWGQDNPDSRLRVVHDLGFVTSYWMRTSPDGRFVANGGHGETDDAASNSTITDLQDLMIEGGTVRNIGVKADYDPSFLPDNSAFLFQGDSTGICSLDVLRDRSISYIDFTQPGCTMGGDNFGMALYQSVGATLDGSDFIGVTGDFSGDSGGDGTYGTSFSGGGSVTFNVFVNDGTRYLNLFAKSLVTPFQGDYAISPSNQLLITRLTGNSPTTGEPLPLGYKFYTTSRTTTPEGTPDVALTEVGTACMKGKKGNMSLDERFWVTYGPVQADEFAQFGFASAEDPEFQKLVGKSENVFLLDLTTGKNHRITRMDTKQFAQFPHFRADGWIVFMAYDANTDSRYVVASDAAIRIAQQR